MDRAADKPETAEQLDERVVERRALEVLGEAARVWAPKLPEDSEYREQFERIAALAEDRPLPSPAAVIAQTMREQAARMPEGEVRSLALRSAIRWGAAAEGQEEMKAVPRSWRAAWTGWLRRARNAGGRRY